MARDEAFARPVFRGGRFEAGEGMPVEALADLVAYAEILTEVAKALFKRHRPDRQRVSRGFEDRLQLRITTVERGSQATVLVRRVPDGELGLPDEYDEARDLFAEVVAEVADGRSLPRQFPTAVLPRFASMGQHLAPGERIAFPRRNGEEAVYDRAVRNRLVALGGRRYPARDVFIGYVSNLNSQMGKFDLRLQDGTPLSGEYGRYFTSLRNELTSPPEDGRRIRVDAEAEFDPNGRPQRLLVLHDVTVLDTWDWARERLAELASLEHGWLEGDTGASVDKQVIDAVGEFIDLLEAVDGRPPPLFPTPEGGIQAEWRTPATTVSVEFVPDGSVLLHTLNVHAAEDQYQGHSFADLDAAVALTRSWLKQTT